MKKILLASVLVWSFGAQAEVLDPAAGYHNIWGLGGHSCIQYDDTGHMFIYSEGMIPREVIAWLEKSEGGTKPNVSMPDLLARSLPNIKPCLHGKHHS
jgi:hypothetical protein